MKESKRPWVAGVLTFVIAMVILVLAGAPIQMALGLWGVLITEIMLLLIAIAATIILRYPLKEVFEIHVPRAGQVAGTVLMTFAAMIINVALALVVFWIFPQGLGVAEGLSNIMTSLPRLISWLIVAVSPAICEEALHRGIILHTFKKLKNKWAIIGWTGLIFGLFHLDPYRLLPTAFIGMMLTYIMLETSNILLPMIYHLVNNSLSVISSFFQSEQTFDMLEEYTITGVELGVYLILAAFAVFLLRAGAILLRPKQNSLVQDVEALQQARKKSNRAWLLAALVALVLFIAGIVAFALGMGPFMERMSDMMDIPLP